MRNLRSSKKFCAQEKESHESKNNFVNGTKIVATEAMSPQVEQPQRFKLNIFMFNLLIANLFLSFIIKLEL